MVIIVLLCLVTYACQTSNHIICIYMVTTGGKYIAFYYRNEENIRQTSKNNYCIILDNSLIM